MSMLEVKGLQKTYVSRFGGNRVEALHREKFGPWSTQNLAPGEWAFIFPT